MSNVSKHGTVKMFFRTLGKELLSSLVRLHEQGPCCCCFQPKQNADLNEKTVHLLEPYLTTISSIVLFFPAVMSYACPLQSGRVEYPEQVNWRPYY